MALAAIRRSGSGFVEGMFAPRRSWSASLSESSHGLRSPTPQLPLHGPVIVEWSASTTLLASSIGGQGGLESSPSAASVLLGLQLTSQGFALDATTSHGFTGSNGLFVVVGA